MSVVLRRVGFSILRCLELEKEAEREDFLSRDRDMQTCGSGCLYLNLFLKIDG